MSYDLYLFPAEPGADIALAWDAWAESETSEPPAEPDRRRNDELADELASAHGLERFDAEDGSIELSGVDGDPPVQISLFASSAAAGVPYWEGEEARAALTIALEALARVQERTGWRAYDPQLERELDLRGDVDDLFAAHDVGVGHVRTIAAAESRRPWWQFWRR